MKLSHVTVIHAMEEGCVKTYWTVSIVTVLKVSYTYPNTLGYKFNI